MQALLIGTWFLHNEVMSVISQLMSNTNVLFVIVQAQAARAVEPLRGELVSERLTSRAASV